MVHRCKDRENISSFILQNKSTAADRRQQKKNRFNSTDFVPPAFSFISEKLGEKEKKRTLSP